MFGTLQVSHVRFFHLHDVTKSSGVDYYHWNFDFRDACPIQLTDKNIRIGQEWSGVEWWTTNHPVQKQHTSWKSIWPHSPWVFLVYNHILGLWYLYINGFKPPIPPSKVTFGALFPLGAAQPSLHLFSILDFYMDLFRGGYYEPTRIVRWAEGLHVNFICLIGYSCLSMI